MLLLPARHTAANPPHAAAAADSWDRRMDGQMDGRRTITQTLQHTMRAVSKTADVLHRMYLRKCPMHQKGFSRQAPSVCPYPLESFKFLA